MAEKFSFDCQMCGARISAHVTNAGNRAKCPKCGDITEIPERIPSFDRRRRRGSVFATPAFIVSASIAVLLVFTLGFFTGVYFADHPITVEKEVFIEKPVETIKEVMVDLPEIDWSADDAPEIVSKTDFESQFDFREGTDSEKEACRDAMQFWMKLNMAVKGFDTNDTPHAEVRRLSLFGDRRTGIQTWFVTGDVETGNDRDSLAAPYIAAVMKKDADDFDVDTVAVVYAESLTEFMVTRQQRLKNRRLQD